MTARPHPPGESEVMRNNESHWSGLMGILCHCSGRVHGRRGFGSGMYRSYFVRIAHAYVNGPFGTYTGY
jgi:hypothetical protein